MIDVGGVAETGMLLLLVALLERVVHALGRKLRSGEAAHTDHHFEEAFARCRARKRACIIVRSSRLPRELDGTNVVDQELRGSHQIGAAAVLVFSGATDSDDEVRKRAGS